jgi:branched-subunit amino acid aminotransferase/4-amino-4-deoxychorismate lyase
MVSRVGKLKSGEIVCLNGKFVLADQAVIPAFEPGVLYGWGLFETLRSYNGRIVYFDAHLRRLQSSCRLLNMIVPFSLSGLKEIVRKTVAVNGLKDASVRLTVWKSTGAGSGSLVTTKEYRPFSAARYKQGFACLVSGLRQNENLFLTRLKTANYLLCQLSYLQAGAKGFDEAIILNNRGDVCEASRSNIFLVKDRGIFTPALGCGCLDGITRKAVFDLARKSGMKIYEARFRAQDLYNSDELFLTNSLMGIMPLTRIEKKRIKSGPVTGFLMRQYSRLLYGSGKAKTSL